MTILAVAALAGCGAQSDEESHGVIEGGSTVTNRDFVSPNVGISYTIPHGYYQDKYLATKVSVANLWQHENTENNKNRPYISIRKIEQPLNKEPTWYPGDWRPNVPFIPPLEDAKHQALVWVGGKEEAATNVRQLSWDGPNLPGGEYAYKFIDANGNRQNVAVAVVGNFYDRIMVEGLSANGLPADLPDVHTVAVSVKLLQKT
ncbi:hypothetical protein Srot_1908 [Segniliparus rotundus DSM 44985]|uniref:Uncharacterized protein n=1 Tax=Segniliparus rotundus (strain ATCC BAA-972 / CDC 1076 / CIP 108378 / DSM 44985 / JCM 13578) TaxID=640132 RepID=D6Z8T7_SEGRD|nr:hypothetical protein [Segniliparus rotundus]ADG98367.1 hypothetical protein Srot_1908 [Segniliparus rotundus DSM 44985]